jgi:hypothetical protein
MSKREYLEDLSIQTVEPNDGSPASYYLVEGLDGPQVAGPFDTKKDADAERRRMNVKYDRQAKFDRGTDAMGHRLPGHFESRG